MYVQALASFEISWFFFPPMYLEEFIASSQNNDEKKANESIQSAGHRKIALAYN